MCQMKDKHIPDSVDIITPYPKKDELQCYYLGPSNCLWTRTLRYTRAGLTECVVPQYQGLPRRQHRQRTHPIPGQKLKFLTPPGIEPEPPHRIVYIVRDNAKKFISVCLSYKDVILFSKILYVFDVVYIKSNRIPCKFTGLNVVATL